MIRIKKKEVPLLYSEKKDCCGCWACYSICPRNAITMISDEEGYLYPFIDGKICVKCYKCKVVCPIKQSVSTGSGKSGRCDFGIS